MMNLTDLSSIGSTVSDLAILLSMLLLNIQVRLSEKNQRALIQQGRADRTADIAMRLMASDFSKIYFRSMNAVSDLSETELSQFMGYCRAVLLGAEDSFLQYRESLLNELAFVSFTTSLRALFESPGIRVVWSMTRDWYGPEFTLFMDTIVKDVAKHPRSDQIQQWKSTIAAELSTIKQPQSL